VRVAVEDEDSLALGLHVASPQVLHAFLALRYMSHVADIHELCMGECVMSHFARMALAHI